MNHEKQRLADIRRRLDLMKIERERQDREFEEIERAVGGDEVEMRRLAIEIDRCIDKVKQLEIRPRSLENISRVLFV